MAIGQEKNTGDSLSIIRLGYSICSSNWPIIHGEYVYVYIWKQLKLLNPNRSLHSLDTKTWLQAAQDHLEMSCAPSAMDKLCVKQLVFIGFPQYVVHYFLFVFSVQHRTRQCYNVRTIANLRGLLRSGRPATTSQGSKPTKYAIRIPHQGAQPRFTQMTEGKPLRDLNIRNMKLHPCISSIGESGIKILHRRWNSWHGSRCSNVFNIAVLSIIFANHIPNHKISEIRP